MNRFALATALVIAAATSAHAADNGWNSTADIDAKRVREMQRIEDGRRSGQLSPREYNVLMREQRQIARDERIAKADGYVSPAERARLNAEVERASTDITRLKHNGETAYNTPWYRRWW